MLQQPLVVAAAAEQVAAAWMLEVGASWQVVVAVALVGVAWRLGVVEWLLVAGGAETMVTGGSGLRVTHIFAGFVRHPGCPTASCVYY